MSDDETEDGPGRPGDVRLAGFADRVSFARAAAWIDRHARILPAEEIDAALAAGRILTTPVEAPRDSPQHDRAAENGYALRAGETIGASDYNPLPFALRNAEDPLPAGAAALVASGAPLPAGADAVIPFEIAQPSGAMLEVFGAVAAGTGVESKARDAAAGTLAMEPGRRLRVQDAAVILSFGLGQVRVVRRPRIKLIIAGPKPSPAGPARDADGVMLSALVRRDGGIVSDIAADAAGRAAMVEALTGTPADAILVAGRTGTGPDDEAPLALAEAGRLSIHGLALRPGGSTGMGLVGGVPVMLLPGDPLACLCAYEMLGGRLIRRLGGLDPDPPHPLRQAELGRKIVSAVGVVDICQVRFVGGLVEPVGSAERGGLASAVRADGFVVIPAALEGYASGTRVDVHVYQATGADFACA
ncbi:MULTISPECIES: molybdopterin molybdotransferase MoeA [unclassified Inquilinus]|uniref:molybdopterin molybdotransferase MoeA n=1 Tax=unclassified Inquilinus TaxID=2645927 RepID=UPI003F91AB7A